jgi:hypothetical protein
MALTRRSLLHRIAALTWAMLLPLRARSQAVQGPVRHILPTANDTRFAIAVSFFAPRQDVALLVDGDRIPGRQTDSLGTHWAFRVNELTPDTRYRLQLADATGPVGEPWPLRTFPPRDALPESFRLLAFTCAGGGDGAGLGPRQLFKPHAFRQRMFDAALADAPDAAIAIGDHIYWDLRGGTAPPFATPEVEAVGAFDRSLPILGTANEAVLKRIADEQIADLYGTRFRSVPIHFVADDHDYFENDDAEEDLVTFPPDAFSAAAQAATAELYYPPLLDPPDAALEHAFGTLVYGRLFESPLFDCAGHLDLGDDDAGLVPPTIENWLVERTETSPAVHFGLVPSHPFGWTAGKWREWYPDVVAPEGFTGVVTNALMGDTVGRLTVDARKYLWQTGWWRQHQRLLAALAARPGSRLVLSGDIHAQGAVNLEASGDLDLSAHSVPSFLVGPVSTSDLTWPSAARGVAAATPAWLRVREQTATREVNGFALFEFTPDGATATLADCGGRDRSLGEDGRVLERRTVRIS